MLILTNINYNIRHLIYHNISCYSYILFLKYHILLKNKKTAVVFILLLYFLLDISKIVLKICYFN